MTPQEIEFEIPSSRLLVLLGWRSVAGLSVECWSEEAFAYRVLASTQRCTKCI